MARTLYIVRHGNTFDKGDTVTRVGARTDLALSRSGEAQATALGAHFRDRGIAFSQAIAGPLKRTRQTADAILSAQANPPELEIGNFLREIDYGPDENKPEDEVIARIGKDALDAWEREAVPPPGWRFDPAAIEGQWQSLFAKLAKSAGDGPVLIVTSNGIARFALTAAGLKPDSTRHDNLKLKTGAYGIFHLDEAGDVSLADWNIRP
ncbi:histidine phosphatase family protein [Henriciella barbarensis]|uniref:Histidine phosphatase family protein n=1 Tax=Henriciella barbarensis TaxID=86342 RepID=A0A399QYC2_9PROT|nr:histidine phosphatase family protein [Henriciella barbarensis]RIJ23783.1 histidine phosphatase family protein [Henriciella barbarensis]